MRRRHPRLPVFQRCGPACPADRCRKHAWEFELELPAGPDGKRRQVAKSGFATAKDAAAARAAVLAADRAGDMPADRKMTVGQWLPMWLAAQVERGELKPSTAHDYRDLITRFLVPKLGGYRLADLRVVHVMAAEDSMRRERAAAVEEAKARNNRYTAEAAAWNAAHPQSKPRQPRRAAVPRELGPQTLRRIRATLSSALTSAVDEQLITTNPARNAKRVKVVMPKVRIWEPEQLGQYLDAIADDRLAPLLQLAAFSGLRRGELVGLRWSDVELEAARLTVAHSRVRVGKNVVDGAPKTASGEGRVVDLDAETIAMLRAWRRRQVAERLAWGPAWTDTGLVFTREDGAGWAPDAVSKAHARLVRQAGLPPLKLHGLRHVAVSLQLAAGVDPVVIAMRTGHSSTSLIRSTYGHLIGEVGAQAAAAAAALVPRRRRAPGS